MSATGFLALAIAGGAGALGVALTVALAGPTDDAGGRRRRVDRGRHTAPTSSKTRSRR